MNGTIDAVWGIHLTPALRVQSGQPFGRVINAGAANGINYGTQRILAEPLGTRKQDNIVILDLRAEKKFKVGKGGAGVGLHRPLQHRELRCRLEHHVGERLEFPPALDNHRTPHREVWPEVRLVG